MPNPPTTNLGLAVPSVGSDIGVWGPELNGDIAILDELGAFGIFSPATSGLITLGIFPETVILASGGASGITLDLPFPGLCPGRVVTVKKMDATVGTITTQTFVGQIDGSATYVLYNEFQYVRMLSDGFNWNVVGEGGD